jgi:hypothetical protein
MAEKRCCPTGLQEQIDLHGSCFDEAAPRGGSDDCICAQEGDPGLEFPDLNQPFVVGSIRTPAGHVPRVSAGLVRADHWGTFKARWGVGRMHYTVNPGLYALGRPDERDPVLVAANYKMSFDNLRGALAGRDAWILVLDTKGINVWCAAGKGTFGTKELLSRIKSSGLTRVISHRELILPQLGASGVAAHEVKRDSGFQVVYGPIQARDLTAFLDAGLRATARMRQKTFTICERAVLIPVELVGAVKWAVVIAAGLSLLGGILGSGGFWLGALRHGLVAAVALLAAVLSGAVLTPLLLPWLPGRAFSLKGLILGLACAPLVLIFDFGDLSLWSGRLEILAWFILVPAIAAFLAMNFTGASTYTSLSGVKKEMRLALPLEIGGCVIGLGLWLGSCFLT